MSGLISKFFAGKKGSVTPKSGATITRQGYQEVAMVCLNHLTNLNPGLQLRIPQRRADVAFFKEVVLCSTWKARELNLRASASRHLQKGTDFANPGALATSSPSVDPAVIRQSLLCDSWIEFTAMGIPIQMPLSSEHSLNFACQYLSADGVFSLVQRHANALGMNFNEQGLTCNMRPLTGENTWTLVSECFEKSLGILGYDYDLYCQGVETVDKAYYFLTANPRFPLHSFKSVDSSNQPILNTRFLFNEMELDLRKFHAKNQSTQTQSMSLPHPLNFMKECLEQFPEFRVRATELVNSRINDGAAMPRHPVAQDICLSLLRDPSFIRPSMGNDPLMEIVRRSLVNHAQ